MPYLFPKIRLQNGEVLDYEVHNTMHQEIAQQIVRGLNEHNMDTSISSTVSVADSAYYAPYYTSVSVNPNLVANGTPDTAATDAYRVPDNFDWNLITGMSQSITTGEDNVWVIATIQYTHHEWATFRDDPAKVQFAIKIDGIIIEDTITGKRDLTEEPAWPYDIPEERANDRSIKVIKEGNTVSMAQALSPLRIQTVASLTAGTHTIEIVARRVLNTDGTAIPSNSYIHVLNRQLFCLHMKNNIGVTSPSGLVDIALPNIVDGTVLSNANMRTNRQDVIVSNLNTIESGQVMPGGLNHHHLPTRIKYADRDTANPGAAVATVGTYPGYGSADVTAPQPYWSNVHPGNLQVDNGGAGFAAGNCFVLVLANLEVEQIYDSAVPATEEPRYFGCFNIGYYNSTSATLSLPGVSEMYANADNENKAPGGPAASEPVHVDIPLMLCLDLRSTATAQIDYFRLYAAGHDGALTATTVEVNYRRAMLNVIIFNK